MPFELVLAFMPVLLIAWFIARGTGNSDGAPDKSKNGRIEERSKTAESWLPQKEGQAPAAEGEAKHNLPEAFDADGGVRPAHEGEEVMGAAYVVDGDTIVIKGTQIRLFGVDAPEMNHPFGKKAKWALVRMCKGQSVRAELVAVDAHDRTVAKCYLPDGRDLSAEMVKQGLAIDWPKFSEGVYAHLETPDARKKMWLADARQKGHMHVWRKFEARQAAKAAKGL